MYWNAFVITLVVFRSSVLVPVPVRIGRVLSVIVVNAVAGSIPLSFNCVSIALANCVALTAPSATVIAAVNSANCVAEKYPDAVFPVPAAVANCATVRVLVVFVFGRILIMSATG